MDTEVILPKISPLISVGSCLVLSIIYVSSLYVWSSKHERDHPSTVKKRFFSVFIVMLISPSFIWLFSSNEFLKKTTLLEAMGLRFNGIIQAFVIPLLLTALLFLGPLTVQLFNGVFKSYFEITYWLNGFKNILWLRNHVVAPISEEFTFRACMMPLLLQSFPPLIAVYITPLFFGVAHFHHMVERLKIGMELKTAIIISCFQFTYTTIFGIYSAYLFTRTGHFMAPFIAHAFCNHMGFPDIQEVFNKNHSRRLFLISCYIVGLFGWILLTPVVTNPEWFGNRLYWKS